MSFARAQRRRQEKAQRPKPSRPSVSLPPNRLDELREGLAGLVADLSALRGLTEPQLVEVALDEFQKALTGDVVGAFELAQLMNQAVADRPEVFYAWARFHQETGRPALAAVLYDGLLQVAPQHPLSGPARLALAGLPSGQIAIDEHLDFYLQTGMYEAASALAQVARLESVQIWCQHFVGDRAAALKAARHLLQRQPDDFQAAFTLFRLLFLNGRLDEAFQLAERLREWPGADAESLAEVAHFQGRDQVVSGLLKAAGKKASAKLHHYAAVSLAHQNDSAGAQKLWRKAIKLDPALLVALRNLANAQRPDEEQGPAWPFDFPQLVPGSTLRGMLACPDRSSLLERFPELVPLVPFWVDRGDAFGFGVALAATLSDPRRRMGLLAARLMKQRKGADLIRPSRLPRYQVDGMGAPSAFAPLPDRVETSILKALQGGQAAQAQKLAQEGLSRWPDHPKLLNHLAVAYSKQGLVAEAMQLTRRNHQCNPDYLFARTALASDALQKKDTETAEAYLAPLRSLEHFHVSEFSALCEVELRLSFARQDPETGEEWAAAWEEVERACGAVRNRPQSLRWVAELRQAIFDGLKRELWSG